MHRRADSKSRVSQTSVPLFNDGESLQVGGRGPLPLIREDTDLLPLLQNATREELAPLVDYILKKGGLSAELDTTAAYRQNKSHHEAYAEDIAAEIQIFGGNTFATQLRGGKGVPYAEIVHDVAKKLRVDQMGHAVPELEMAIVAAILGQAWGQMTPEKQQDALLSMNIESLSGVGPALASGTLQMATNSTGFLPYQMTVIAANGMANAILGHGLSFTLNAALTKSVWLFAGPLGWVFTALLASVAIGGPAYRVTIPCVVQVAMIRQAALRRRRNKRKRLLLGFAIAVGLVACFLLGWLIFTSSK